MQCRRVSMNQKPRQLKLKLASSPISVFGFVLGVIADSGKFRSFDRHFPTLFSLHPPPLVPVHTSSKHDHTVIFPALPRRTDRR